MDRASLDPVMRYREYVEYQLAVDGEGIGLRQARQVLAGQGIESLEIMTLDALAIEAVQMVKRINPVLLHDASDQPLASWWWHLGKLRAGTYPEDLLPPRLREVYLAGRREAA